MANLSKQVLDSYLTNSFLGGEYEFVKEDKDGIIIEVTRTVELEDEEGVPGSFRTQEGFLDHKEADIEDLASNLREVGFTATLEGHYWEGHFNGEETLHLFIKVFQIKD